MGSLIILRLLHVVVGATWVGIVVFLGTMLVPTMRALGPAGTPVMAHLARVRRFPLWMMGVAWITIITGFMLSMRDAGDQGMAWFQSGMGKVIGMGAIASLIAVAVGMSVTSPAARRLGEMAGSMAGRAPTPEEAVTMQALQKRMGIGTLLVMILVLVAVACMSVARYTT